MVRKKTSPPAITMLRGYDLELPRNDLAVLLTNTTVMRPEKTAKSSRAKLGVIQQPIEEYHQLLEWMRQVDAIRPADARELQRQADENPGKAADTLNHVLNLRDLFTRITNSLRARKWPAKEDIELLSAAVDEVQLSPLRFISALEGGAWTWDRAERNLDWPRRELVLSMTVLLSSKNQQDVRQCASKDCSVVFVDNSRARQRRWCNMIACGNLIRMRRRKRGQ